MTENKNPTSVDRNGGPHDPLERERKRKRESSEPGLQQGEDGDPKTVGFKKPRLFDDLPPETD